MKSENLVFQQFCQRIIATLQEDDINTFSSLKDDEDRIRYLYKCGNVDVNKTPTEKCLESAKAEKEKGNSFYSKKNLKNAIVCYSKGIIICPQDSDSSKELLAILAANRSAVLYEMNKTEEAIRDIEYALEDAKCPKNILYKLYIRKGKCLLAQQDKEAATLAFEKARDFLSEASLKESALNDRKKEIADSLKIAQNINCNKNVKSNRNNPELNFPRNKKFNGAHSLVDFSEDVDQGRFAVAKEDLPVGTVVVEEKPFCSVLAKDYHTKNCQNCIKSVKLPIACPRCSSVVFCSLECRDNALDGFHSRECEMLPSLIQSAASVNCAMALRLITCRDLNYFRNFKNLNNLPECEKKNFEFFNHIYSLCRHEEQRQPGDFLLYTAMALFLLKLLMLTDYFGNVQNDSLSDTKAFVGSLILRFLQILQFNSHELSELQPEPLDTQSGKKSCVSVDIGGALYPTLALFNHSCEPSIVRYNIGNRIVARLIKSVKKGDIIYENYGPMYTTDPKLNRQKYLKDRYWFICKCIPCEENWPLYEEMDPSCLKIPCKTNSCKNYVIADDKLDPFKNCPNCGAVNTSNILNALKMLQGVDSYLNDGEAHFKRMEFKKAISYFLSAMKIYHLHTVPPFPDYIKVQQRLRTCIVHMGNKYNELLDE
ncbi:SET and MYND domain-containing protein DDB_G0284059 [Agrilus planipennis]|uniref:Protein-lysine N-methyltransferase SMYD4 n=1 Tax=Agrilus planipennis TaxID=224129 RepID=A0A1W4WY57_AGRPL|nr:SET and MYND domain-containing protein DDB_G0284059 [Agrilus planipennis]XP_018324994.1 SET and MYND domain-containing protein DDB_G0284059 [Agrilus planipennis]XP_018324995.1 SET and MYND domain-containing protein DDB_G0284059 [Agrilus planipennis]